MMPRRTINLPREGIHQYVFTGSLFCIAGSLPYSISLNSIFIIILGLNWLCSPHLRVKFQEFYKNKYSLLFVSLYFCYVIGLLYSQHPHVGFSILEYKLSLLVFPLILSAYNISRRLIEKVLMVFVCSCLIAAIISTLYTIKSFRQSNNTFIFNYRETLVDFFNHHPTYLSIYLLFCICILVYLIYTYWERIRSYQKLLAGLLILYFLGINLLLSSRMPFISFILIGLSFLCYLLIKQKRSIWLFIIFSVFIGLLFILYKIPTFNQRFVEIINTPLRPPIGISHNSTNLRVGILTCSLQVLKENWLFGVGTGDMQTALNNCYQTNGYSEVMYKQNYDPHNQFIEIWLNVGIVGILILLLNFIIPLRLALKHKTGLYTFFLLFVMLCCITESILNVQKGVVFYAFFNSLFCVSLIKQKD